MDRSLPVTPRPLGDEEVPDPFLHDSESDSDQEASSEAPSAVASPSATPASDPVPLATPPVPGVSSPAVSKDAPLPPPPPPESSDEDDDDEAPELYLPTLVAPTMFLPIPNTDQLSTLLAKYVSPEQRPVRDVTGEWQRSDFNTLVMTNSWRALARMARDRIVATNPEDLNLILSLWYLRLACLARLRLYNQTTAECTNLFSVLNAVEPPHARVYLFERLMPFELEVMYARLKYWAGDHMGYLDELHAVYRKCRAKGRAAKTDDAARSMWKERGARLCLIMASQLVEMKDYAAATKLLEPLPSQPGYAGLRSAVARIYLQAGYLSKASELFTAAAEDPTLGESGKLVNEALMACATGDWVRAETGFKQALVVDGENYPAVNDLAVALLSQGKLTEGIEVLESALRTSPSSVVVAEPFLFNLATLYELRSATAADKKRALLVEVAKWSGDGLRSACLKMPLS